MLERRDFLSFALASGASAALARPAFAQKPSQGAAADTAQLIANAPHDQSAALQRAIDNAARRGVALTLPAGRFIVGNITLPSATTLTGVAGMTRLVRASRAPVITIASAKDVRISDLIIDGAGLAADDKAEALLVARQSTGLTVCGVTFVNTPGYGLALEASGGRVERSNFQRIGQTGLFALNSRELAIEGNSFTDIGSNAIQVWQSEKGEDGTLISHNRITHVHAHAGGNGQNGNGINIYRAGSVTVSANTISDCAFSAIRNHSGSNFIATSNQIARCGEVALFVEFAYQGASIANNVIDGAAAGISVSNFDEGGRLAAIVGNIVRNIAAKSAVNPDTLPYGIAVEADASVIGNTIENVPGVGIRLGWGPYLRDVTASANVVRGCDVGIAVSVVKGAGVAIVSDNILSGSKRAALAGMEWQKLATGDLAQAKDGQNANLTFARNRIV